VATASLTSEPVRHRPRRGVALVGYRGTGKSTVGQLLAAQLGQPFHDADQAFEARVGQPIRTFFEQQGEPAFRDEEEAILCTLVEIPDVVLATGGGVVLREANRKLLKRLGTVVWLYAPPDVIVERLRQDRAPQRPALTAVGLLDEVAAVLEERTPLYRQVADLMIDTSGRTPESICEAIRAQVRPDEARRA
jgi:shikimate kinase